MTDYELEKYITNNIEKILEMHISRLKHLYDGATIGQIVAHIEDIRFIKYMEGKSVRIGVIDVEDRKGKSEEQA